jgi:hypothetical protein
VLEGESPIFSGCENEINPAWPAIVPESDPWLSSLFSENVVQDVVESETGRRRKKSSENTTSVSKTEADRMSSSRLPDRIP